MADELQTAMDALDVIGQVFELGSTFAAATGPLAVATGPIGAAISVIGAILGLIGNFLPDRKHEEILQGLRILSRKIDLVRGDIQQLEDEIKWEITQATYANPVHDIMLGIEYVQEIGKASGNATRMTYLNKLRDHCSGERCSSALTFILNGINGRGQRPLLDQLYDTTAGNRSYISARGTSLLQLVAGGMIVVSTYDTAEYGKDGATAVIENYNIQLNESRIKVESVLKKCINDFKINMLKDLNKELDEGGSNSNLRTRISNLMRYKYDWLENFVLVYKELYGPEKHCFKGNQVSSLRRNEKCGIVFYRTKGDPPKFTHKYNEAYQIVNNGKCGRKNLIYRADRCLNDITSWATGRGVGWIGSAVIKSRSDIMYGGTFSTRIVLVGGSKFTKLLLLQ